MKMMHGMFGFSRSFRGIYNPPLRECGGHHTALNAFDDVDVLFL